MRTDHIALYVRDLEGARAFFTKYFGGASNQGYHNPKTTFRSYFLRFEDGSRLELMTREDLAAENPGVNCCGYAHLAFGVGSTQAVDRLTSQLKEDGYAVISGPRTTGDGYYESCVAGFEGNLIEITV